MRQAFIIMQIGNPELDILYRDAFCAALEECGFAVKRVDKHNEGRLLKSEIVGFIEESDLIIADLTNERPNCYLEVGYAMGLDKFRNLVMTAREDHNPDSKNYRPESLKIHFDLSGYDILFWDPGEITSFKEELVKRIRRRIAILEPEITTITTPWDGDWIGRQAGIALEGLKDVGLSGFMEMRMNLIDSRIDIPQGQLLQAAEQAQVHTFGWPIGIVLSNREEYRPRPRTEGITAEIAIKDKGSYDYWALRKDGAYYLLKSLFEDQRRPGHIFFNTRIVRITEALIYAARLYTGLSMPSDTKLRIGIRHGGLSGRILSAAGGRDIYYERSSKEDEVYSEVDTTFEEIESSLVNIVDRFTQPLFILFDFFEVEKHILEKIVNDYVAGKVS
jgi:hypothetical protein